MTIAPWKLPIRTLRWGRFLTPHTTLIWIDWQGPFTTRLVFLNGQRVLAETLDDGGLLLDNGVLISLDRAHVVRQGSLGSTVFAAVPGSGRIAPARMFRVEECKWKSRARMQSPGGAAEDGWCIHEAVNWPSGPSAVSKYRASPSSGLGGTEGTNQSRAPLRKSSISAWGGSVWRAPP